MGIRDILRKKDQLGDNTPDREQAVRDLSGPQFTFIRSDTLGQERIEPPAFPPDYDSHHLSAVANEPKRSRLSLDVFRSNRSRSASVSSQVSNSGNGGLTVDEDQKKKSRRISERFHLSRAPASSENVPQNLPEIRIAADTQDKDAAESAWEQRATILAGQNDLARTRPATPDKGDGSPQQQGRARAGSAVTSSKQTDDMIQEAIRLHEEGDLARSTELFKRLADPHGANNTLSQVLYGLALRHGWGCSPDPVSAVQYLSAAASNAAVVEQMALQAGRKKGGELKGELVLAIFELANCFRHGWGIPKDPIAAKQYYETAANLGDTDAMNEVAWCYLEGFGCKKDKFAAARYYRLAEKAGSKTLGNSWIWKDKYDPPGEGSKK
ncbi:hypothetical protein NLU13_3877 [Sarocladium strictum]|uniref:Uncharacterized protein n=1 Tax=Sarocladium strictum TaxID=5046 RepID=A0AA39L7P7_SARSR|nr:hypothetical protein NLU13_3877 [Sarocladium strictum]